MAEHLKQCWSCRRRAGELEDTVRAVSKALDEVDYPGPQWVAEASIRIKEGQQRVDRELTATPKLGMLGDGSFPKLLLPAAGLALLLLTAGIWRYGQRPGEPTAVEVIALAGSAEGAIHQEATRQIFTVELTQVRPEPKQRSRRLEIWSDPEGGRSAARWKGPAGNLKYAVYRPERGRRYIYDPKVAPAEVVAASGSPKAISVFQIGENGLDVEELEIGFMKWLAGRQWQPVALVRGLASFASQDGVVLAWEPARMPDGTEVLRVSARRADEDLSVQLLLVVDASAYRPQILELRFETPGRIVHVRIIAEESRQVPPERLSLAVFEPDYPHQISTGAVAVGPLPATPTSEALAREGTPRTTPSKLIATEVEARYALHRVRACLGDPVAISHDCESVRIRGVVSTSERKNQLIAALAEIEETALLIHDLRTVDEALAAEALSQDHSQESEREGALGEFVAEDGVAVQIAGHGLPIQDHLVRYFRANREEAESGPNEVDESVRRLATEVVTLSGDALAEAWALRRLVEASRPEWTRRLPSRSRWLLEAMFEDHLTELEAKAAQMRRLVEPALRESAAPTPATTAVPSDEAGLLNGGAGILDVFEKVEEVRSHVLSLFADSGPTLEAGNPRPSTRFKLRSPEQTMRVLLDNLPRVEAETRRLRDLPGMHFSRDAATTEGHDPCGWRNASL